MTPPRTCTRCLDRPAADGLGWCRGCRHADTSLTLAATQADRDAWQTRALRYLRALAAVAPVAGPMACRVCHASLYGVSAGPEQLDLSPLNVHAYGHGCEMGDCFQLDPDVTVGLVDMADFEEGL